MGNREYWGGTYGMFNYGDYGNGGFGWSGNHWANLEYDGGYAGFLQYARTGNRAYFDYGEAASRHLMDVDIKQDSGRVYSHFSSNHQGQPNYGHFWNESLVYYYFLTGDSRSLEVAKSVGTWSVWIAKNELDYLRTMCERETGWPLISLVAVYQATGEKYYLDSAKLLIDMLLDWQDTELSCWRQNGCCDYPKIGTHTGSCSEMMGLLLEAMIKYWEETKDERVKDSIIKAVDFLIDYYWVPCEGTNPYDNTIKAVTDSFWVRMCPYNLAKNEIYYGNNGRTLVAFGWAWDWTKNERYMRYGIRTFDATTLWAGPWMGKQMAQYLRSNKIK